MSNASRRQRRAQAPLPVSAARSRVATQGRLRGVACFASKAVCPATGALASKRSCVVVGLRVVATVRRTGRCAVCAARERMHAWRTKRGNVLLGLQSCSTMRRRAPRWRERQIQQRFCLRAVGVAPAAERQVPPPVLGLRAYKMQAMRCEQPNPSIERTNNGGQQLAALRASRAPLFAAHVER
jgi:hypothetical protein